MIPTTLQKTERRSTLDYPHRHATAHTHTHTHLSMYWKQIYTYTPPPHLYWPDEAFGLYRRTSSTYFIRVGAVANDFYMFTWSCRRRRRVPNTWTIGACSTAVIYVHEYIIHTRRRGNLHNTRHFRSNSGAYTSRFHACTCMWTSVSEFTRRHFYSTRVRPDSLRRTCVRRARVLYTSCNQNDRTLPRYTVATDRVTYPYQFEYVPAVERTHAWCVSAMHGSGRVTSTSTRWTEHECRSRMHNQ